MLIAVLGAGALGRVYGGRLAAAGVRVVFVVRRAPPTAPPPIVLQERNAARRRDVIEAPVFATETPADAALVLLAVRYDQVDEAVEALARTTTAPVVSLTPLLVDDVARLSATLRLPIVPAMAGVVGYADKEGVVRYWTPRLAPTFLDESGRAHRSLVELTEALERAGLSARFERDVARLNTATTLAFFPLVLALDAAGNAERAVHDRAIRDEMLAAVEECGRIARRVGRPAPWATMLLRFVGPLSLRMGLALARRANPEAIRFAEEHFGRKVHAQNLLLGEAVVREARATGDDVPALRRLLARARDRS